MNRTILSFGVWWFGRAPLRFLQYLKAGGQHQGPNWDLFVQRRATDIAEWINKGTCGGRLSTSDGEVTVSHKLTAQSALEEELELGWDYLWTDLNMFVKVLKMSPEVAGALYNLFVAFDRRTVDLSASLLL